MSAVIIKLMDLESAHMYTYVQDFIFKRSELHCAPTVKIVHLWIKLM